MKTLKERCAAYLDIGPPLHMTDYVPDSLTEIIIGCGASGQALDDELADVASLILGEVESIHSIQDPDIRGYMLTGVELVREVLNAQDESS